MSPERNLQQDMFTGGLVDNRTRAQKSQDRKQDLPHQEFLFSQRDLVEPARHHYFETPSNAPLFLQSEDPRSDEERQRDEQRAIESAMNPLFARELVERETTEEDIDDDDLTEHENPTGDRVVGQDPASLRHDVYLELVRLSEEQAETLWIAPPYDAAYTTQIGVLVAQARSFGLTEYEINLAVRVGHYRGAKRKESHHQHKP